MAEPSPVKLCGCGDCFRGIPENTEYCVPCTPPNAWHGPGALHGYQGGEGASPPKPHRVPAALTSCYRAARPIRDYVAAVEFRSPITESTRLGIPMSLLRPLLAAVAAMDREIAVAYATRRDEHQ